MGYGGVIDLRKNSSMIVCLFLLLCLVVSSFGLMEDVKAQTPVSSFDAQNYTLSHLTATDAFGRTFPEISGYKSDRYVGIFYFLWHAEEAEEKIYNMTDLLNTVGVNEIFKLGSTEIPNWTKIYFNEPLYGYYSSNDEWVMRKHIEQFIMAGIDYLVLDFTNGTVYWDELYLLMDLLLEYQNAGWKAPKVTFYVNLDAQTQTRRLYNKVYKNDKYKNIVFYGNSTKPMIISVPHELSDELNAYFDVRISQFHEDQYSANDLFYYMEDTRPPLKTNQNVMNVSIAQMSGGAFGYAFKYISGGTRDSYGRGWSSANPKNHDSQAIMRGDNFQEEWEYAISADPENIFVTGWNEWTVSKMPYYNADGSYLYDVAIFWDTFNTEYSRDAEMTKYANYDNGHEGYGDNYYLQIASNVRKYKGVSEGTFTPPQKVSIDINGDIAQWEAVRESYVAISTAKTERNAKGTVEGLVYTQAAPENFVKEVKITHDENNVYFLIETDQDISQYQAGKTNWMNLLIGVDGLNEAAWETFNYVVNRNPGDNSQTSLEKFTENGSYSLVDCGQVASKVTGQYMQISIPKSSLGISGDRFRLTFKVTDSVENPENILDYYVSGESFPMGRMAYVYETVEDETPSSPQTDLGSANNTIVFVFIGILLFVIIGIVIFVIAKRKKRGGC